MKFCELTEQREELFPDLEEVKLDPDRDGPYDVARHLLPAVVKIAYANLHSNRHQHHKKHGPRSDEPDAYNFEFTHEALEEEVERVLEETVEAIKGLKKNELTAAINKAAKDFKDPLEKD